MPKSRTEVVETINRPNGFDFDLEETYKKIIAFQFGGDPFRGSAELIQNAIDSYPSAISYPERRVDLATDGTSYMVRDYGEGMDLHRINMVTTIGGTDKANDSSTIGQFGLGFYSIFNPKLGTRRVSVQTGCEGYLVEIEFVVDRNHPERIPTINTRVGGKTTRPCGTTITTEFDSAISAERCLEQAKKFLHYFPCKILINGQRFSENKWGKADFFDSISFRAGNICHGILSTSIFCQTTILCKYERILACSFAGLATGGLDMSNDLSDYRRREFPLVPRTDAIINHNGLSVTISRDSIRMDHTYESMIRILANALLLKLNKETQNDKDLIPANQFILSSKIRAHLDANPTTREMDDPHIQAIDNLARAQIYRINGERGYVSLADIRKKRTEGIPVFFSPQKANLNWLGGAFEHDFIVLPPDCAYFDYNTNCFYETLFNDIVKDSVNLDTIHGNTDRIAKLVERGLVEPEALSPDCKLIGQRDLSSAEKALVAEMDELLADPRVLDTIRNTLFLQPIRICTGFFDFQNEGITVATGLFDKDGSIMDNMEAKKPRKGRNRPSGEIKLGLMRSHPVIDHIINCNDPHRAYYTLTFLAHELASCQKQLSPFSAFRNWVIGDLAKGLRQAMIGRLLNKPEAY